MLEKEFMEIIFYLVSIIIGFWFALKPPFFLVQEIPEMKNIFCFIGSLLVIYGILLLISQLSYR